jgi:hypothetical protein
MTMVTLSCDCYYDTLGLWQPFFAKGVGYFTKVLSFCLKMPGVIHPTGLTAVYGCTSDGYRSVPILCSVFSLSLHPWEAPGWQVIPIDADVKQVITSWLQTLDNSVVTLVPLWGKCQGDSGGCVDVWCVPSASYVPRIDRSHNYILTWDFVTLVVESSLYVHCSLSRWVHKYCEFWRGGGGSSVSFADNFYNELSKWWLSPCYAHTIL